jgi:hypothetical protein
MLLRHKFYFGCRAAPVALLCIERPCASPRGIGPWRKKIGSGAVPQIDPFEMTDQRWDYGMAFKLQGVRRVTLRA